MSNNSLTLPKAVPELNSESEPTVSAELFRKVRREIEWSDGRGEVMVMLWIRISIDSNSFSQKKKRLWQAFLTKIFASVRFHPFFPNQFLNQP